MTVVIIIIHLISITPGPMGKLWARPRRPASRQSILIQYPSSNKQ